MTKDLQEIIERVKAWPAWRQADAAHLLEAMERSGTEIYQVTDEERRLIDEGFASPVVTEEEMEKFWNRHRV
jgi:hypothetical protein